MTVIAFTQEMATLGSDVAAGVCEALGLAMVRHEVGDHVAGKMHVKKSLIRRLREGKAGPFERWTADERSISLFTAEEVYDLAVKGGVLVRGWGATMILRTVAHVPCIRVCAPMDLRVERLMRRLETDDEKLARHEIAVDDHARASVSPSLRRRSRTGLRRSSSRSRPRRERRRPWPVRRAARPPSCRRGRTPRPPHRESCSSRPPSSARTRRPASM